MWTNRVQIPIGLYFFFFRDFLILLSVIMALKSYSIIFFLWSKFINKYKNNTFATMHHRWFANRGRILFLFQDLGCPFLNIWFFVYRTTMAMVRKSLSFCSQISKEVFGLNNWGGIDISNSVNSWYRWNISIFLL